VKIGSLFAKSTDDGALTPLYAAASPEIDEKQYSGLYFVPGLCKHRVECLRSSLTELFHAVGKIGKQNYNQEAAQKLYDYTHEAIQKRLTELEAN
jgi:hypothetical protein